MAHWFDDLTKTMADEKIGRRAVIRRVAGTVVGVAFAGILPGTIQAKQNKQCPSAAIHALAVIAPSVLTIQTRTVSASPG